MEPQTLDALRVASNLAQGRYDAVQDLILLLTADGHLSPVAAKAAQAAVKPYKVQSDAAFAAYMAGMKDFTVIAEVQLVRLRWSQRHRLAPVRRLARARRTPVVRLLAQPFN